MELFQNWLSPDPIPSEPRAKTSPDGRKLTRFDHAHWREIRHPYIKLGMSHDLDEIKEAIAHGWGEEAAAKFKGSQD